MKSLSKLLFLSFMMNIGYLYTVTEHGKSQSVFGYHGPEDALNPVELKKFYEREKKVGRIHECAKKAKLEKKNKHRWFKR